MLFFRKPNPQKTFDYKQFSMINKQFKKEFKSIFNILDHFNDSILKITSLELPSLLIDIEDYVRKLNETYLANSNYNSRATYSYLSNLEQKALVIESKTSEKTEKLMTLYINEEKVSKLHYEDFKELLNKYHKKSIFLENFFEKLDKKGIEMTEHQIKRTHFLIDDEIEKHNNKDRTHDEQDQVFEYIYKKDEDVIKYQVFFMNKLISSFILYHKY
jgi:hypothetical protein